MKCRHRNKRSFAWVQSQGPQVNWVKQARWVENGKFATSSGVSAGIDMAMEYEWHRDAAWDPFAKIHGLV